MSARLGQIVVLNGVPRAGKSSIAEAFQATLEEPWVNLGVDLWRQATPATYQPGIGLRPGGERPDLEPFVVASYAALYDAIAASSRQGLNVVVDVGHHDAYSKPLGILPMSAARLEGLPSLFVGVRCPLDVIMSRRNASEGYASGPAERPVPVPVRRWQDEVHRHGVYDLEVDTSVLTPEECAAVIRERVVSGPPGTAFARLASLAG